MSEEGFVRTRLDPNCWAGLQGQINHLISHHMSERNPRKIARSYETLQVPELVWGFRACKSGNLDMFLWLTLHGLQSAVLSGCPDVSSVQCCQDALYSGGKWETTICQS